MRCERIAGDGNPGAVAARLRELVPGAESVRDTVGEIIAAVRDEGDAAVLRYTARFDTGGVPPPALLVEPTVLETAAAFLDAAVRAGLELAIENVRDVAHASVAGGAEVAFRGHTVSVRTVPVARAAVYVPGGRAPYPSTVVMGVVPARAAHVREIAVCTPPGPDGEVDQDVLAACAIAGASRVYRMGGAQAIAALAYGTESVEPVEVIVGPGNLYVQEAKRQVFGRVGVDGFAGPSDLIVIAQHGQDPALVALDLLAQAEHGTGTVVAGLSDSADLLCDVARAIDAAPETGAAAALVRVADARQALAIAEAYAPEHLQLIGATVEAMAELVTAAGCVFVGPQTGTAFGDYIAGSNHILPTAGAARFASALSPDHFRRRVTTVRIEDPAPLARAAAPVARAEGFELHARSMEARIRDNQPR
jgi:histidinol dehydrogenase